MSFDPARVRVALNESLNNPNYVRQTLAVGLRKIVKPVAVYIENAEHIARRVEYRHDYLRSRRRAACNMPRKLVDIRYDHCFSGRICVPADALTEVDPRACERSLERAEDKL